MRAYSEQDTFVKIEYNNDKVFLITATPVNIENTTYIVEILKDISKNAKICDDKSNLELNISDLINKLNESSIRDGLTGIYNRRYINERLPVDINDSIVKEKPVSLIMADIDDLKEINDKYGHVIGDKVIISLTQLINDSIRKSSDWVSRYGGDEFLIVLNDVGLDDAYKVAEKIRNEFNSNVFKVDNNIIKVTASFGVYGTESKEFDVEKIIGNVDTNLYKAKINGKNLTYAENNLKLKEVQLSILERRIDDLRDTLNEICISTDEENANEFKLNISKYLDELIVDYIKKI
ncbi:MAG: GGDEF domain-containing protein [Clostridiaceae bacterium]|nr:GGDEF domain-containing protein [Clostridiaceae bacterium]